MIHLHGLALVAAVGMVMGCMPAGMPSAQTVATDPTVRPGAALLSATEAVRLFGDICGGSLPDFTNAPAKAPGSWTKASTGTYFSQQHDASFKIADGPSNRSTCSFVFATTETQNAVQSALARRGKSAQTALGFTVGFDQKAVAFINGSPRLHDGKSYYNLRMLSE